MFLFKILQIKVEIISYNYYVQCVCTLHLFFYIGYTGFCFVFSLVKIAFS